MRSERRNDISEKVTNKMQTSYKRLDYITNQQF